MKKLSQSAMQTRKNIKDAFWRLYKIKPIEKITISDICKIAGYNRSTFYAYFKDIYDVLDAVEYELISVEVFQSVIFDFILNSDNEHAAMKKLLELFEICDEYFAVLLGSNGDPKFREKLLYHLSPIFDENIPLHITKADKYVLSYQNAGVLSAITRWYQNKKDISSEELIQLLLSLTRKGTQSILLSLNE